MRPVFGRDRLLPVRIHRVRQTAAIQPERIGQGTFADAVAMRSGASTEPAGAVPYRPYRHFAFPAFLMPVLDLGRSNWPAGGGSTPRRPETHWRSGAEPERLRNRRLRDDAR